MRVTRLLVPVILAAAWGIVAARWTPRGPLTNPQALWSIGISAAVGMAAGWVSRSRWAMLTAPAGFIVALELTRMGVRGPSVGAAHLSTFGLIALVTGRGVHGLLSVFPMVLGAGYGKRANSRVRATFYAAGLILVTIPVAIPAHTSRIPEPNSVAELSRVGRLGVMI